MTSAAAGTDKGRERARVILDTAVQVFLEQGYANFTMRAVAEAAGMSIGNLTYYFPRKETLLKAMTEYVIEGYLTEFERQRHAAPASAEEQLDRVLDFWLRDLGSARTTRFFPELWALANHEPAAAQLVDYVYEQARAVLLDILDELLPGIPRADLDDLTVLMCATMEGLTLFAGNDKPWQHRRDALRALAKRAFMLLRDEAGAAD